MFGKTTSSLVDLFYLVVFWILQELLQRESKKLQEIYLCASTSDVSGECYPVFSNLINLLQAFLINWNQDSEYRYWIYR